MDHSSYDKLRCFIFSQKTVYYTDQPGIWGEISKYG